MRLPRAALPEELVDEVGSILVPVSGAAPWLPGRSIPPCDPSARPHFAFSVNWKLANARKGSCFFSSSSGISETPTNAGACDSL